MVTALQGEDRQQRQQKETSPEDHVGVAPDAVGRLSLVRSF